MSLQKGKTNPELGKEVNEYLKRLGVETPMVDDNSLSSEEKIQLIESSMHQVLKTLGLDLNDDSLIDTPKRVAKMYVNEIYWGLDYNNFPKCTVIDNKMKYDEMVVECNIKMISDCEHHLRPIDGVAHVAYIPNDKVLGLSKMNRIVEFFARRPQVQERIAEQIYHALSYILETRDVAVVVEGVHYCVKQRGVEDDNSYTVTSKLGGGFKTDSSLRQEFLSLTRK